MKSGRLVFAIVGCIVLLPQSRADWPVFRGNPQMTGTSTAKLPDQLRLLWTFRCSDAVEGAPAIVGNRVFVAAMDGHLYCLDRDSGKEIWRTRLGPMKASPAHAQGRVYIGNVDGKVYAIDADSGKKLWSFETGGEITSGANFYKDRLLIGSHDSTLYCLSHDGKKLWEYKIDGPINGSPAVVEDRTFVAGCDSVLHAVDARTGKVIRTVELHGQAGATAAIHGDLAVVGTMANQVVAIDWRNGQKLWSFEARRRQLPFYASAAVDDERVVVGSRDKKIYALNPKNGEEVWSFVTAGQVDASPIICSNRIYAGCLSRDGDFYVLDRTTGRQLQHLELESAVTGSPAVVDDRLIVGTEKGVVFCFGR